MSARAVRPGTTAALLGSVSLLLSACSSSSTSTAHGGTGRPASGSSSSVSSTTAVSGSPPGAVCPAAGQLVGNAAELTKALGGAAPGTTILLASGTYSGHFAAKAAGTSEAPIVLCGPEL